jgi:organic radical activating enzyme
MNDELENIKNIIPTTNAEISPTFCMAKWHHTTIYLQTGETHSCYHPAPHKIPLEEIIDNPSALHNTKQKKAERKEMMCGNKPGGCNYCWNIEAMGEEYVSDRHIKTASIYTPERLEEIKQGGAEYNVNPEYIEISFANECNFKCGYCHPKASSRYWQEIKKHGPYDMSTDHRQDIDWFKVFHREDENPYVKAWWAWWPEVSKTLNILRITGGEPLMHKSTWELFERLDKDPKPHMQLEINSNLGVKPALVKKMTDTLKRLKDEDKIRSFKLYTSIDTWTDRAEYTRTGLDIDLWEQNLDYFLRNTGWPVTFMITFNLFSVTSFDTLLEKILEWREKYNDDSNSTQWQRIRFDTPHLKEPTIYDMNILPKAEFMPFMNTHLDFFKQNLDDSDRTKFTSLEYEKFKRVVDYMESTYYDNVALKTARINFYNWFNEHDRRRGTNLVHTFPELQNFYELCEDLTHSARVL